MDYKGTLTKVSSNKNALRTKSIDGVFNKLPTLRESFHILGASLTKYDENVDGTPIRLVSTSPIVEIRYDIGKCLTFKTYSGTKYHLKYK